MKNSNFLVDSHCHLDFPQLQEMGDELFENALSAGVGAMLTISVDLENAKKVLKIAKIHKHVCATIGIHPHEAAKALGRLSIQSIRERFQQASRDSKIVGFGETGLDYYYNHSPRSEQETCFKLQVEEALKCNMPLVVHSRDAEEDTIRILKDIGKKKARGVIHCFSGSLWFAEQAINLGFYISLSGVITYKKNEALREVVSQLPLERLLVETDSPFLAPEPYRGQSNQPSYVVEIAKKISEVKGLEIKAIKKQTTANFFKLFNRFKEPTF